MALVVADRVQETSNLVGLGNAPLLGALLGYRTFLSAVGDGNTAFYGILHPSTGDWEVGIGTVSAVGPELSRGIILASTNGGAPVNFSAGLKYVFSSIPAARTPHYAQDQSLTLPGILHQSVEGVQGQVKNDITTLTRSGFFYTDTPTVAEGWPVDTSWYQLLSAVTGESYWGFQIAASWFDSNEVYFRSVQNVGTTGWNKLLHTGNFAASSANPIPAGTVMLFHQTAAPTGWTKSVAHNNKALRVVSGAVSVGGSVPFSTAFASKGVSGTVGSTTLALSQVPSHQHLVPNLTQLTPNRTGTAGPSPKNDGPLNTEYTDFQGGGGSHNHSFTGTAIDLTVQYVDVIIATKN